MTRWLRKYVLAAGSSYLVRQMKPSGSAVPLLEPFNVANAKLTTGVFSRA